MNITNGKSWTQYFEQIEQRAPEFVLMWEWLPVCLKPNFIFILCVGICKMWLSSVLLDWVHLEVNFSSGHIQVCYFWDFKTPVLVGKSVISIIRKKSQTLLFKLIHKPTGTPWVWWRSDISQQKWHFSLTAHVFFGILPCASCMLYSNIGNIWK